MTATAINRNFQDRRGFSNASQLPMLAVSFLLPFLGFVLGAGVVSAAADEVRVIRSGNVTQIESRSQGTVGTAIKAGPITTYEFKGGTKVQSIQMGNVTQYKASDGATATAVDTGPVRSTETEGGKSTAVRIGNVVVGTESPGAQSAAVQGNIVYRADEAAVSSGEQGVRTAVLIEGTKRVVTETRSLDPFSALIVSGGVDVAVTIGQPLVCSVTAAAEVLPMLDTTVSDDTLRIRLRKSARLDLPPKVQLTLPDLSRVESSGSGRVVITGLQTERLSVRGRGTAGIVLSGTVGTLDATVDGTGMLDARFLEATDAVIVLNGTASAHVNVRKTIACEINGDGDVVCHGRPQEIRKMIEGVGDCVIVEKE